MHIHTIHFLCRTILVSIHAILSIFCANHPHKILYQLLRIAQIQVQYQYRLKRHQGLRFDFRGLVRNYRFFHHQNFTMNFEWFLSHNNELIHTNFYTTTISRYIGRRQMCNYHITPWFCQLTHPYLVSRHQYFLVLHQECLLFIPFL